MLLYYVHRCVVVSCTLPRIVSMPIIVSLPSKSLHYIYILVYFLPHQTSTYNYKAFQWMECLKPVLPLVWRNVQLEEFRKWRQKFLSKYQTTHDLLWSFIYYEYQPYNWLPKWVTDIFENAKILNTNQEIKGMINKYTKQLLSDWGLSSHIHQSDGMSVV